MLILPWPWKPQGSCSCLLLPLAPLCSRLTPVLTCVFLCGMYVLFSWELFNRLLFSMAVISWTVGSPYLNNNKTHILKQLLEQFQGPEVHLFARRQFYQWTNNRKVPSHLKLKSASLYHPIILPPGQQKKKIHSFFFSSNEQSDIWNTSMIIFSEIH